MKETIILIAIPIVLFLLTLLELPMFWGGKNGK